MASERLLNDFETLNRKEMEEECIQRGIQPVGLEKREMVRRLKAYERRKEKEDENRWESAAEEEEEEEVEEEGEEMEQTGFNESRIRLELIRAEERREEAAERKAKAERERMETELMLIRERAQLGLLNQANSSGNADRVEAHGFKYAHILPTMHESENPLSFFLSFEKVAQLHNINVLEWPKLLPALLNSSLRQHYNRLSYDVCKDYKRTKAELLAACQMNPRFYLDKFKSMQRSGKETYSQFLTRLSDMQEYYLEAKEISDFTALKDDMLAERLRDSLASETKYFVEARKPTSALQIAKYAELHFECTREAKREGASKPSHKPQFINAEVGLNTRSTQWRKGQT